MTRKLLSPKELAAHPDLDCHVSYIYAIRKVMQRQGIGWIAGKQSARRVVQFLEENPGFRKRDGAVNG